MTHQMTPILQQFLSEAHDFLQGISEKLMQLENAPGNTALMGELFRLVHTLKGNCGLFDFPEMLRVLHVAEDLMSVVRNGDLEYSQLLADRLLDAMDFVSMLLDEIEASGNSSATHAAASAKLAQALRQLIPMSSDTDEPSEVAAESVQQFGSAVLLPLAEVPEALRMAWYRQASIAAPLLWVSYTPEPECFFKGEDPFFQVRQTPQIAWQRVSASEPWPELAELDAYRCVLSFQLISTAPLAELEEHFRYVPEQISIISVPPIMLALPFGDENGGPVYEDFIGAALAHLERGDLTSLELGARSMLELSASGLWLASALRWLLMIMEIEPKNHFALRAVIESLRTFEAPILCQTIDSAAEVAVEVCIDVVAKISTPELLIESLSAPATNAVSSAIADAVISAQLAVLGMPDQVLWLPGRLKAVAATLTGCYRSMAQDALLPSLDAALAQSLAEASAAPLLTWLLQHTTQQQSTQQTIQRSADPSMPNSELIAVAIPSTVPLVDDSKPKFARRAEDAIAGTKTLKVDQDKIDRLMNLIGEMVVAKNGLPYLAVRAETVFGVRELSREIKTQYAVINRIAEEMQDAIMQVRMLPVSFVFQRFPRLVRDISRKLGKEVNLVLEGEDTEADKNIIEALADPLIHIVRNSLDHGIESPEVRRAAGKPAEGRLVIRASQEAGRVVIDISDDGKGIDPVVIKRKAYEKGIIDETVLERISDQDAINLVFAAGFSTAEVVSDLSGRGVGMDVVRAAVEQVNGTVTLESQAGQGTRLRLSLPLSMAVTNVIIIESNQQIFGVPMDMVVETVRIRRSAIHSIKNHQTAVLRGRIVPLRSLNELLATDQPQLPNEDDEFAMLVIRMQGEHVGIVVDDFREVVDIILKPMGGILGGLSGYTGSALLGDGSVLMVLNLKELV
ncbi:MAG: chemotaxis protein CheA [Undibacterium sp.]|uniref:chemotaxis protein CheA n=1 Tax=Undibacterium sp. TaxID=1914977 RepID=UPI0027250255|nr:chemotaxis protein CheA [Undibacterium sp.]MDO8652211.1 chemotaxis protein CheA [Undibacterium sp.]